MVNRKAFETKQSWSLRRSSHAFASKDWQKPRKIWRVRCSGGGSNWTPPPSI